MQDIKTLTDTITQLASDTSDNNYLLISCVVFVFINFLIAGFNLFFQFKLKDREKKINSFNLKEVSRIQKIEELYSQLEDLKYFSNSNQNETQLYLSKIFDINSFISKNGLYINKKILNNTNLITDYFLIVISDYGKKDYKKEDDLFKSFINEFNL